MSDKEKNVETCAKKDCPFIPYCNRYRLDEHKGVECETQTNILLAASRLVKKKELRINEITG